MGCWAWDCRTAGKGGCFRERKATFCVVDSRIQEKRAAREDRDSLSFPLHCSTASKGISVFGRAAAAVEAEGGVSLPPERGRAGAARGGGGMRVSSKSGSPAKSAKFSRETVEEPSCLRWVTVAGPGGSACCHWNGDGTQCGHPAQGRTVQDEERVRPTRRLVHLCVRHRAALVPDRDHVQRLCAAARKLC